MTADRRAYVCEIDVAVVNPDYERMKKKEQIDEVVVGTIKSSTLVDVHGNLKNVHVGIDKIVHGFIENVAAQKHVRPEEVKVLDVTVKRLMKLEGPAVDCQEAERRIITPAEIVKRA